MRGSLRSGSCYPPLLDGIPSRRHLNGPNSSEIFRTTIILNSSSEVDSVRSSRKRPPSLARSFHDLSTVDVHASLTPRTVISLGQGLRVIPLPTLHALHLARHLVEPRKEQKPLVRCSSPLSPNKPCSGTFSSRNLSPGPANTGARVFKAFFIVKLNSFRSPTNLWEPFS